MRAFLWLLPLVPWLLMLLGCQPIAKDVAARDPRWTLTDYLHALEAPHER